MKKVIVVLFAVLFVMGSGLAFASPKVGGLSQKGSLLIFPKIDTTPGTETYILLSNDNNQPVSVYCDWVQVDPADTPPALPECLTISPGDLAKFPIKQTPSDSLFTLTPFQPVMFAASTGLSDDPIPVTVNPFGTNHRGYFACWAVDFDGTKQISFNHLSGMAYVLSATSGYSYPAWTFQGLGAPFKGAIGQAGTIKFDAVEYDAMPQYLVFTVPTLGTADNVNVFQNLEVTLLPGKQNFTNMTLVHNVTRAIFDAWNENEVRYSGGSKCGWCYWDDMLSTIVVGGNPLFAATNMHTSVARFRVNGAASGTCLPNLTQEQIDNCIGVNTVLGTYATPFVGFAIQSIGPSAGAPVFQTTNLPVGVAQDFTATFVWKPY